MPLALRAAAACHHRTGNIDCHPRENGVCRPRPAAALSAGGRTQRVCLPEEHDPPAGSKSVEELTEIVQLAERPSSSKAAMTVKGALKAKQAGAAAAIVVSTTAAAR